MITKLKRMGAIGILSTIGLGAITSAYSSVQNLMTRVAVLEKADDTKDKTFLEVKDDIKEIKTDIKTLLQRK